MFYYKLGKLNEAVVQEMLKAILLKSEPSKGYHWIEFDDNLNQMWNNIWKNKELKVQRWNDKWIQKAFYSPVGKGWKNAVSNPSSAIDSLVKRNPAADKNLEERRFNLALSGNVMTDYVLKNGMGNIDKARFEAAIAQLSETYKYKTKPNAKLYFTDAYLPKGGFKLK